MTVSPTARMSACAAHAEWVHDGPTGHLQLAGAVRKRRRERKKDPRSAMSRRASSRSCRLCSHSSGRPRAVCSQACASATPLGTHRLHRRHWLSGPSTGRSQSTSTRCVGPPTQHGLPSDKMAPITSEFGTMRAPAIKTALITSGCGTMRSPRIKTALITSGCALPGPDLVGQHHPVHRADRLQRKPLLRRRGNPGGKRPAISHTHLPCAAPFWNPAFWNSETVPNRRFRSSSPRRSARDDSWQIVGLFSSTRKLSAWSRLRTSSRGRYHTSTFGLALLQQHLPLTTPSDVSNETTCR